MQNLYQLDVHPKLLFEAKSSGQSTLSRSSAEGNFPPQDFALGGIFSEEDSQGKMPLALRGCSPLGWGILIQSEC
ncbi:MAG: hypothetical protein PUP91_34690 [Rhizonema sp. PD37]|nr:hypothetical protein [Rhizonema sp. PD37]